MKHTKCLYRLWGICITMAFWQSGEAQVSWDSTARPDVFNAQVALHKTMPKSKKDNIFAGDSITFWGDWTELLGNKKYKNRGIPGDTSFGLLERLDDILSGQPKRLFIMIGINDLSRSIPVEVLLDNYRRMIQLTETVSPKTKLYFQTILPVNRSFQKLELHYKASENAIMVNENLRQWAAAGEIQLIDLTEGFSDQDQQLKKEYSWDGIHLTVQGYQQWVNLLKAKKLVR